MCSSNNILIIFSVTDQHFLVIETCNGLVIQNIYGLNIKLWGLIVPQYSIARFKGNDDNQNTDDSAICT